MQVSFLRGGRPVTTTITLGPPLLFDFKIGRKPECFGRSKGAAKSSVVEREISYPQITQIEVSYRER